MDFFLPIEIKYGGAKINYESQIYLTGSCFTEHISNFFRRHKFRVEENSHGILFNPISVCESLIEVVDRRIYLEKDLFYLNEYWHSWNHHSDFSFLDRGLVLKQINESIDAHHHFLKNASHLIVTFGSAFAYYHLEGAHYVSNNHRAPQNWFRKDLLSVVQIMDAIESLKEKMKVFNPSCQLFFTISPVRHIRDGVVDNNRSKARLIEAVHAIEDCFYFPSYEIVIDVLRDYRFFDADLVHPNFMATKYVWNSFVDNCMDCACYEDMKLADEIYKSYHHKPKSVDSNAHQKFLKIYFDKVEEFSKKYPFLDFETEKKYFGAFI